MVLVGRLGKPWLKVASSKIPLRLVVALSSLLELLVQTRSEQRFSRDYRGFITQ